MSKSQIQLSRPLYHGAAAGNHGVAYYHDDLHVDLHDCGRLLCLELRGQNGVHGAEPHLPYLQMLGCLNFYDRHGRRALVAMTLGMGDEKRANRLFSMLAVATVGIGAIFSVIGLALLRPVALLLGATDCCPAVCCCVPHLLTFQTAFMLQYLFQSFFIAAEKPKLGLFFTVAAGVTNMVLDFVLVGVAGLGLAGAASATVISQMVGGVAPISTLLSAVPLPPVFHKAAVQPARAVQSLHQRHQRADDEYLDVAGRCAVQYAAARSCFGADGVAAYGVLMYMGFVFAAVFIGFILRVQRPLSATTLARTIRTN